MSAAFVRSYRVAGVSQKKGGEPTTYKLTVPPKIARLIPPDTEFVPEMTEDGLLYRRVENSILEVPSWAKNER